MKRLSKVILMFLISMVFVVCPCFASQSIDKVPVEFITGTEISAEDGLKPIEEIQVGDKVWAYNEQTGETSLKEVERLYQSEKYNLVEITVNGEVITSTDTHPYFVQGKGWIRADELEAGDVLIDISGGEVVIDSLNSYTAEEPVTVYNFEVQESHTYFVGEQRVLVHNRCGGTNVDSEVEVKYTTSKLQHEYKHASDFGVEGNWNNSKAIEYQKAIQNHINGATDVYLSSYRGQDVNLFYNSNTGLGAYVDLAGNYVGGWKLSPKQVQYHITNGIKIK